MSASTDNIVAIAGDVARNLIKAWEEEGRLRKAYRSQAELQKLLLQFVAEACDTRIVGYDGSARGHVDGLESLSRDMTLAAGQLLHAPVREPVQSFFQPNTPA